MSGTPEAQMPPLLAELRALAARRDWAALADRAAAAPAALGEHPEAAFLHADALRRVGRSEAALPPARAAEAGARRAGDQRLLCRALNVVGMTLFDLGRMAEAEATFAELLDSATEWGDEEFAARASNNLGVIANVRGDRARALVSYQQALAAYQRLGELRGLAQTHHNLAISYRDLGFERDSDAHLQQAIGHARRAGSEDVEAVAESERAMLRARSGDHRLAERLGRSALRRFEALGDPLGRADALRVLGAAARAAGRDDLAARRLQEALDTAHSHADPLLRAEVQRDRGFLLRDQGRPEDARDALLDAAQHFEAIGALAEAVALRSIAHQTA